MSSSNSSSNSSSSSDSSDVLDVEAKINIGMTVFYGFFFMFGIPILVLLRNREPIRSRGWVTVVLQMSAAMVDLLLRALTPAVTGCWVQNWRYLWFIPIWVFPYFARVFVLWYNFSLQNVLLLRQGDTAKGKVVLWVQAHSWFISFWTHLVVFGCRCHLRYGGS